MTLFRVLDGSVKKNGATTEAGGDVELTTEEAERLNKNGRKTVEATSLVIAREKAEAEKKKTIDEAEKKVKAEAEKKKGGGQ